MKKGGVVGVMDTRRRNQLRFLGRVLKFASIVMSSLCPRIIVCVVSGLSTQVLFSVHHQIKTKKKDLHMLFRAYHDVYSCLIQSLHKMYIPEDGEIDCEETRWYFLPRHCKTSSKRGLSRDYSRLRSVRKVIDWNIQPLTKLRYLELSVAEAGHS
ncbi:hypothetical protein DY000_02047037 [Brassica cretica]|uniref:Uncharacterized protein n=1 Tax=Brassica cretica TaxID=69181 RepID=A0ABQ7F8L5_BRACR|nr:hypothetical protein DY000_02047037 [Brassica cretica]